jgi:hypothetical protein
MRECERHETPEDFLGYYWPTVAKGANAQSAPVGVYEDELSVIRQVGLSKRTRISCLLFPWEW